MNMAMEDRQELEAQLRQLHADLTEGQDAAHQEGRKEAERLEARVKELLRDRSVRWSVLHVPLSPEVRRSCLDTTSSGMDVSSDLKMCSAECPSSPVLWVLFDMLTFCSKRLKHCYISRKPEDNFVQLYRIAQKKRHVSFGTHRDRKQAELDLQNARRKETREMARDLESQLAAVERIAQVSVLPATRFPRRWFCGGLIAYTP